MMMFRAHGEDPVARRAEEERAAVDVILAQVDLELERVGGRHGVEIEDLYDAETGLPR